MPSIVHKFKGGPMDGLDDPAIGTPATRVFPKIQANGTVRVELYQLETTDPDRAIYRYVGGIGGGSLPLPATEG